MLRLGLTGGIGSGKSTVAQILSTLGAAWIDADEVSRKCTAAGGLAMQEIAEQFGPELVSPDGAMDRPRMRELVFSDPEAKQRLEMIIHPLVHQEVHRLAQLSGAACVVFDVPLLVESTRWRVQLDRVLVVDCSQETQIQRVILRNGFSRPQVQAIIQQQSSRERRLSAADWVLNNEGIELPVLQAMVMQLARRIGL
jgi:dephospho-CoA kinase